MTVGVCFVCLGNICRSPTAEGVMRHLVAQRGYQDRIEIDSAGTGAFHVGESPDPRSREEARRRGIELAGAARQFRPQDFDRFDYVIAMDRANHRDLAALTTERAHLEKLQLLRSYDLAAGDTLDVPDPYFGGDDGFAHVFEICLGACNGLLAHIAEAHGLE